MRNRSDRRGGKPTTRCAFSGRADDWLPARGFSSWPEASRFKLHRPKIRMQSDPSVYRYLRRLRGTGIGNLIEGGTGKCTLLTEESRYGVVLSRFNQKFFFVLEQHHPGASRHPSSTEEGQSLHPLASSWCIQCPNRRLKKGMTISTAISTMTIHSSSSMRRAVTISEILP